MYAPPIRKLYESGGHIDDETWPDFTVGRLSLHSSKDRQDRIERRIVFLEEWYHAWKTERDAETQYQRQLFEDEITRLKHHLLPV